MHEVGALHASAPDSRAPVGAASPMGKRTPIRGPVQMGRTSTGWGSFHPLSMPSSFSLWPNAPPQEATAPPHHTLTRHPRPTKSIFQEADAPRHWDKRERGRWLCFPGDGRKCSGIFHISDAAGADAIWLLKKNDLTRLSAGFSYLCGSEVMTNT